MTNVEDQYFFNFQVQMLSQDYGVSFTVVLIVVNSSSYVEIGLGISESIQERNLTAVRSVGNPFH